MERPKVDEPPEVIETFLDHRLARLRFNRRVSALVLSELSRARGQRKRGRD